MRINEIELSKSHEKEIGEMILRKSARLIKSNPNAFPSWFKFFSTQFSGPTIAWPAKGKQIVVGSGLEPLSLSSDIWMNINGYSTNEIFIQDFVVFYAARPLIFINNKEIYFSEIAKFMAKTISSSDPAFNNITPEDFDVRLAEVHGREQYILSRSLALKIIIEPEMKKHSWLISMLYRCDKLIEFANLIRKANP